MNPDLNDEVVTTAVVDPVMSDEGIVKLKKEISEDPEGLGYAGKTAAEIADLLNKVRIIKKPIIYVPKPVYQAGDVIGETVEYKDARTAIVLQKVENVPNVVTEDDVKKALK